MRQTTSTMLQQNNNNNYPCLNMSGSTREMLQKCSRAALPFPSRMELGDLPLIRGLRAWALCSKNRRKAGGLLGAGQAPTVPPAGCRNLTSCPKSADEYLSREWGHMGYGLPLGLDARQAEIGALVTVATLKTSEGSGKTQTQCLFVRTEKGSCLYSTAKPGCGVTTGAASGAVGGWLRVKTGGGRDTPAGRRDSGGTPLTQTGVNRVRVRSGRRWRKSSNAAGREKPVVSRERQERSREDPAGEIALEKRKEVQDKGALDSKQFPSPQQDGTRARQEKEGVSRTPRSCHNASPKSCTQGGRRAERRQSQEDHEGGESPSTEIEEIQKERQKNKEVQNGGLCELRSSNSVLAVPSPDLETNCFHPESPSGCDVEEIRDVGSSSHSKDSCTEKEQETNSDVLKVHTGSNDFTHVHSGRSTDDYKSTHNRGLDGRKATEETADNVNGFSDCVEENQESGKEMEGADVAEEERRVTQIPTESLVVSDSVPTCRFSISSGCIAESSTPVEGSICTAGCKASGVKQEQEKSQEDHLEGYHQGEEDPGMVGKGEPDVSRFEPQELNLVADENKSVNNDLPPFRLRVPSISEADVWIVTDSCRPAEAEQRGEPVSGGRLNPERGDGLGEIWKWEHKLDDGSGEEDNGRDTAGEINVSAIQEDNYEVESSCAPKDDQRLQESGDGCRKAKKEGADTGGQTTITSVEAKGKNSPDTTNVACADPSTSTALAPANPAPSLPPLGSMATGLPCLREEEEEWTGVTAQVGEGGQEGKKRHGRELEEQGKAERGSNVATEEGMKDKEEEEGEEDEFGVFMQAEEPAWSVGFAMSASVPCGIRDSVALAAESSPWTPGWTGQSDNAWTAFPRDSSEGSRHAVGQWWPASAAEERGVRRSASETVVSVFAEAFPSLPASSSSDPCDLDTVPTLIQLLRARASQDQGLLDSFHDLNKMIGQRYKRASGVSRDLLLRTLHLEQPHAESRPAPWTANRRLSPGLPSANQHALNAVAKRRLSYDHNRNIMD